MRRRSQLDERSRILLDHVRSGDTSRELYVRNALAELEPDEAAKMLVSWIPAIRRERARMPIRLAAVWGAAWAGISLADWAMGKGPASVWFAAGGVVIPMVVALADLRYSRNKVYRFLARYDDKRIADVLIEAMRIGDEPTQRAAESALLRLLSAMTPVDLRLLSQDSRTFLNRRLLESDNKPLVNSILMAWEQVGSQDSIPFVERLSRGEGVLGGDFSVRHTAAEALPAIREAANRAAMSETLLRPATADDSTTALLRPASSADSANDALLRPAD